MACNVENVDSYVNSISNLQDIKVELGQSKSMDFNADKLVINVKSIQDSRCPKDVQCVWQGEGRLTINVSLGSTEYKDVKLCLDCSSTDKTPSKTELILNGKAYTLSLTGIEPFPSSLVQVSKPYGIFSIK